MDKSWQKYRPRPLIGVDEAGRGCLAGPVYAAAVILNEKGKGSLEGFSGQQNPV